MSPTCDLSNRQAEGSLGIVIRRFLCCSQPAVSQELASRNLGSIVVEDSPKVESTIPGPPPVTAPTTRIHELVTMESSPTLKYPIPEGQEVTGADEKAVLRLSAQQRFADALVVFEQAHAGTGSFSNPSWSSAESGGAKPRPVGLQCLKSPVPLKVNYARPNGAGSIASNNSSTGRSSRGTAGRGGQGSELSRCHDSVDSYGRLTARSASQVEVP